MMVSDSLLRFFMFAALFVLLLVWEHYRPARDLKQPRLKRNLLNLGLGGGNQLLLRLLFPVLAVEAALLAQSQQVGLFHLFAVPYWLAFILTLILFDLLLYWQHRLLHVVPLLWRIHAPHHADPELDVSTGLRFHPLEIIFSMGIKLAAVFCLGPPAYALLWFEILLNGASLFSHTNGALPPKWDARLRWLIITPAMHRIHHSQEQEEMNRNFGFLLSCWDRLFASYLGKAAKKGFPLGLASYHPQIGWQWHRLLLMPFRMR